MNPCIRSNKLVQKVWASFVITCASQMKRRFNMTRLVKSLFNRNLLALMAFATALAPQALKAADALCPRGNATRHGTYMLMGTGTIVGGPITTIGEVTFDGKGNQQVHSTASVNGIIYQDVMLTGTYTINPDCTGTTTLSDGSHYNSVTSPDGKKFFYMQTDAGTGSSGIGERLEHADSD
jgi:hypothetical protein